MEKIRFLGAILGAPVCDLVWSEVTVGLTQMAVFGYIRWWGGGPLEWEEKMKGTD